MKVDTVAKELVERAGKDWDKLDEKDKTVYRDIARAIMLLSSDVKSIED